MERSDGDSGLPRVRVGRVHTQGRRAHESRVPDGLPRAQEDGEGPTYPWTQAPEESNKNRFEILCLDGCIESDGLVDNLKHCSSITGKKNDHVPSPVAAHPRVPRPRHPARHSGELKRTFCGYSEGLCGSDRQDEKEIEGYIGGFFAVDEELHGLGQPEWVSIEVVMDSGAAESVPWVPIKESDGARAGRKYFSASGEVLQNLGEKMVSVYTNEGMPAEATFQVADVTRPLCSIARVCDRLHVNGRVHRKWSWSAYELRAEEQRPHHAVPRA